MIRYAMFLLAVIGFTACGGDDDEVTLEGADYQLVRISGGLAGTNEDLSADNVFWSFSEGDDLSITKMTSRTFSGPEAGDFKYEYVDMTLSFGEEDTDQSQWLMYGVSLSSEGDTLLLDEGQALDGFLYTFYRR